MEKIHKGYLEQISKNMDEKVGDIVDCIQSGDIPRRRGRALILELGIGGGEGLNHLTRAAKILESIDVIGVDNEIALVELAKQKDLVAIHGSATSLPFDDESVSAINASAVFHEVFSYSQTVGMTSRAALSKAFREIDRVLMPGGKLFYRDVLCPDGMNLMKCVIYERASWISFTRKFLELYHPKGKEQYSSDPIRINDVDDGLAIECPIGLHREIQRHYLTFRDYVGHSMSGKIGIAIEKNGKEFAFRIQNNALRARYTEQRLIDGDNVVYSGTIGMDLFDAIISDLFEGQFGQEGVDLVDAWFVREGRESYVYGSCSDLQALLSDKKEPYKLKFISSRKEIRQQYLHYLRRVISSPEEEGKQFGILKKELD